MTPINYVQITYKIVKSPDFQHQLHSTIWFTTTDATLYQ